MSNETYKNFLSVTATRTRGVGREWEGRFTRPAWPASWRGTRWCSRSRSRRATRTRSRAWPGSAAPGWSAPRWSAWPGGSMSWRPSTWPAGATCPQLRGRLLTTRCSRHLITSSINFFTSTSTRLRLAEDLLFVSRWPGSRTTTTSKERTLQRRLVPTPN